MVFQFQCSLKPIHWPAFAGWDPFRCYILLQRRSGTNLSPWKNMILSTHHLQSIFPPVSQHFLTIFPCSHHFPQISHNFPTISLPITSQQPKNHHLRHVLQRAHAAHHRHNRRLKQRLTSVEWFFYLTNCWKIPNPVVPKSSKHLWTKVVPC